MRRARQLRQRLSEPDMVVAPGAYDGIGARFIEQAGFPAIYMTGAGTSAALGFPDFGLLTLTEMADNAGTLARAATIPVIADADTGYGNELNVTRTVREYEARDVAGLHIEDQVSPKRCGHLDGKEVVSREEFAAKIRAAVAARQDPDFLVIARTDARAVLGFEEAVARANLALEAGADMAFVEAVQTLDEMQAVPQRVTGPCLLNIVRGGKTPDVDLAGAQAMGYRLAILPSLLIGAAMEAFDEALAALRETRAPPASAGGPQIRERFNRMGANEWDALRTRFQAPAQHRPALPDAAE
jgi:2-methylisocitrate lyase-like PEP mutase family enzyme